MGGISDAEAGQRIGMKLPKGAGAALAGLTPAERHLGGRAARHGHADDGRCPGGGQDPQPDPRRGGKAQQVRLGDQTIQNTRSQWEMADRLIELACGPVELAGFSPAQPRVAAGQAGGGQFGGGGGGQAQPGGKGTRAQRRARLVKWAVALRGEITALLAQIHAATHKSGHSKSSTPSKKARARPAPSRQLRVRPCAKSSRPKPAPRPRRTR